MSNDDAMREDEDDEDSHPSQPRSSKSQAGQQLGYTQLLHRLKTLCHPRSIDLVANANFLVKLASIDDYNFDKIEGPQMIIYNFVKIEIPSWMIIYNSWTPNFGSCVLLIQQRKLQSRYNFFVYHLMSIMTLTF